MPADPHVTRKPEQDALVDLLGDSRARIVAALWEQPHSVGELTALMGMSEVAVRRHVQLLERDGLVSAQTIRRDGPGRPCAQYALTARGRRLFPDRSAEFASELLEFLQEEHGRGAVLRFMKWRQGRHRGGDATGLAAMAGTQGAFASGLPTAMPTTGAPLAGAAAPDLTTSSTGDRDGHQS